MSLSGIGWTNGLEPVLDMVRHGLNATADRMTALEKENAALVEMVRDLSLELEAERAKRQVAT